MNTLESQLSNQLHSMMDGDVSSTPPTQLLLDRAQRAVRRRSAGTLVGAAVAVVAVGGLVAAGVAHSSTPKRPGVVAQTQTPRLRLAAAVSASQSISYQVKVTEPTGHGDAARTWGAFDPAAATGYLNFQWSGAPAVANERLIDGVRYVGSSGANWSQEKGTYDRLDYDPDLGGALSASADPQQLFDALRQAGAQISQAGAGIYHFSVTVDAPATARTTLKSVFVGDVSLNADNRVAKVSYQDTTSGTKDGTAFTHTDAVTVELSGYGLPVKVDRPTNAVIVK
jgi:hypothetical protein